MKSDCNRTWPMFRRRRPLKSAAIHFSFDSFLDLVTNVVGIIIRFKSWSPGSVRAPYHASMQWLNIEAGAPPTPAAKITDDPLHHRLELSKHDLDEAKTRLLAQLQELEEGEKDNEPHRINSSPSSSFAAPNSRPNARPWRRKERRRAPRSTARTTADDIRKRSRQLLDEIKLIESAPTNKKQLKYHAPVSRAVRSEELFFECKAGRVTFIDLPSFMAEYKQTQEEGCPRAAASKWTVERADRPGRPLSVEICGVALFLSDRAADLRADADLARFSLRSGVLGGGTDHGRSRRDGAASAGSEVGVPAADRWPRSQFDGGDLLGLPRQLRAISATARAIISMSTAKATSPADRFPTTGRSLRPNMGAARAASSE